MSDAVSRSIPLAGWVILAAALLLTGLGLLGVYAGEAGADVLPAKTLRQIMFLCIGLAGFVVIQVVGYREIGRWAYPLFSLMLVLLVLLIVAQRVNLEPIIAPRRYAYRWIVLGPINIQVSEYTKLVYVLALAFYLRYRTNYRTLRGLLVPFVLTLVPLGLILKEPDLGTSLLLLPTLFVMLYAAGAKNKHLSLILALGLLSVPVFYHSPLMNEYQRERIRAVWYQDQTDQRWLLNAGYQLNQSKIATGSGRAFGQGFAEGAFFRHDLLPEEHNDFIFAVIAHQWGFVGSMFVLLCYLAIIAAGLTIASMTNDPLGRLLAVGICALICAQTYINIGMTQGLTVITGMSLPFVSMGGSGLITNYFSIGLLVNVSRRRAHDIARKPFEYDDEE